MPDLEPFGLNGYFSVTFPSSSTQRIGVSSLLSLAAKLNIASSGHKHLPSA
jgi:hypothetical protein